MKYVVAAILASSLVACASNDMKGGDNNPGIPDGEDPGFTNPGVDAEQPKESAGYEIAGDSIYYDGEVMGVVKVDHKGNILVVDPNDDTIVLGRVSKTGDGYTVAIEGSDGKVWKDIYYVRVDDGKLTVDWSQSKIDWDWGVDPDSVVKPEQFTAEQRETVKAKAQHLRDQLKVKRASLKK